jgi:hypothetical protein
MPILLFPNPPHDGSLQPTTHPAHLAQANTSQSATQPQSPPQPQPHQSYDLLHLAHVLWEHDEPPPQTPDTLKNLYTPQPLLHLYTITGLLLLGYWPHDAILGEHYIAWAYQQPQNPSMPPASILHH